MAYVKKISADQFVEMIINKELEMVDAPIRYNDLIEDSKKPADERQYDRWWVDYSFKTKEQFLEWKQFFFDHFYDWQPKRIKKSVIEREFRWANLQWGLTYDFEI